MTTKFQKELSKFFQWVDGRYWVDDDDWSMALVGDDYIESPRDKLVGFLKYVIKKNKIRNASGDIIEDVKDIAREYKEGKFNHKYGSVEDEKEFYTGKKEGNEEAVVVDNNLDTSDIWNITRYYPEIEFDYSASKLTETLGEPKIVGESGEKYQKQWSLKVNGRVYLIYDYQGEDELTIGAIEDYEIENDINQLKEWIEEVKMKTIEKVKEAKVEKTKETVEKVKKTKVKEAKKTVEKVKKTKVNEAKKTVEKVKEAKKTVDKVKEVPKPVKVAKKEEITEVLDEFEIDDEELNALMAD